MTVCEESVIGNIRPSPSVLSRTPRVSNQATVSLAWNRWKCADQRLAAAGIVRGKRAGVETGMGDVAAPPA